MPKFGFEKPKYTPQEQANIEKERKKTEEEARGAAMQSEKMARLFGHDKGPFFSPDEAAKDKMHEAALAEEKTREERKKTEVKAIREALQNERKMFRRGQGDPNFNPFEAAEDIMHEAALTEEKEREQKKKEERTSEEEK